METREETRKKIIVKVILITVLLVLSVVLIGFAFARYITSLNGSTQAPIARWNFNVTAGSSENLNIDLAQTRYANDTTEVDRTKVAPGTKGAIQLNVDATGSQVSLKYDIDLSLTQIPENLIFYYDEDMTNAMYKEDGKIHINGYFGANDSNKTATKNLYWQWKLETGSTQAEIDNNDILDSKWMGDSITLGIEATGRQVMEDFTTQYNVTLDLNDGTLANHGDSTQVTKQVNYGETYGTLPTPTREGYTFMGWNGKNLFDYKNIFSRSRVTVENEKIIFDGSSISGNVSTTWFVYKNVSGSYVGIGRNVNGKIYSFNFLKDIDFNSIIVKLNTNKGNPYVAFYCNNLINNNTYTLSFEQVSSTPNEARGEIKNIQLEEGSIATAYEPYYITSSTEVVQNQNHTLTAIWKKE